ncbi:sushi, nidogen and EGF-like domain-containing protein 1 [Engraulis encrasicolus]|uniref:sushi, nidogen and EGF-like domain-containing protein 1 n=1 Tax=Engraulis encrasicolus TaxID=184585 RepID=UPI002FD4837D
MVNSGSLCLLMLTFGVCTNAQDALYPFGSAAGDTFMPHFYHNVTLLQSFHYFNRTYQNIYVFKFGFINMQLHDAIYADIIAPFALVSERQNVSYQQYTSGDVLHTATQDINSYFPNVTFTATWVFVATWDRVVFYLTNYVS